MSQAHIQLYSLSPTETHPKNTQCTHPTII